MHQYSQPQIPNDKIVMMDEPKTNDEYIYKYIMMDLVLSTKGTPFNTAGWTSVEVAGQIIEKLGLF